MYGTTSFRRNLRRLTVASCFLALALVLPLLTGQIPRIGNMLCPMHLPVMLCGYLCGPVWGTCVGLIAPLLRFVLFGAPEIMPRGLAMSAELAAYIGIRSLKFFDGLQDFYRCACTEIGFVKHFLVASESHHPSANFNIVGT